MHCPPICSTVFAVGNYSAVNRDCKTLPGENCRISGSKMCTKKWCHPANMSSISENTLRGQVIFHYYFSLRGLKNRSAFCYYKVFTLDIFIGAQMHFGITDQFPRNKKRGRGSSGSTWAVLSLSVSVFFFPLSPSQHQILHSCG